MLNFYPSPIECLIYRANNKLEIKGISGGNKEDKENESQRKIINDQSNVSVPADQREMFRYNQAERDATDSKMVNQQNDESGNKIAVELRNLGKNWKIMI